ncbi:MAG: SDR family oxidoreductase [Firmicutes bacterium]|nr:SDR family oxidoreductase [Bacillota bacterium]
MKVNGKVIVVTGAGGGVGRELVLQLLAKGAVVAAIDINKQRLEETAKIADKEEKLSIHVCDITNQDVVTQVSKEIIELHKVVDGLINNAGIIQPFIKVNDLDYGKINMVMNVNFYGTLYMIKAFLPHLLTRPEGHVLNVSSMGGFFPFPGQSIYGASKAAIKLLTEGLYAELLDTNVNVTIVFPGAIATDIAKNSNVSMTVPKADEKPAMKMLPASDCAAIIINGMEKNKFQVYAGKDSKMMRFMYKLSPKAAIKMISKMMKDQIQ